MAKGRNTTATGVRLPDELHDQAKARAEEQGITVSMLIRKALEMYMVIGRQSERSKS